MLIFSESIDFGNPKLTPLYFIYKPYLPLYNDIFSLLPGCFPNSLNGFTVLFEVFLGFDNISTALLIPIVKGLSSLGIE